MDIEYTKRYSSTNTSISLVNGPACDPPCDLDILKHFGKKDSIESLVQKFKFFKLEQSPTFVVSKLLLLK